MIRKLLRDTSYELRDMRRGWTYAEMIVALGIIGVLVGLTTINLLNAQSKANQSTSVDSLAADIALQQTRAMTGDQSVAGTKTAYGIYFQSDRYVLFKGNSYSASDPENFSVPLVQASFSTINFSGNQLIFASTSGEFANYASDAATVVLTASGSGTTKTLHINNYGVLDSVN